MQPGYRKVTNSVASIGSSTGFMNQSNVVDFGDLTVARMEHTSFSNAHGGL